MFSARCARCHGTYSSDPNKETYPNLVVNLDLVLTDPVLAIGSGQFATRFVDWFNSSYYGEIAKLEPQRGYIAPPLDGIWATAPVFSQWLSSDARCSPRIEARVPRAG